MPRLLCCLFCVSFVCLHFLLSVLHCHRAILWVHDILCLLIRPTRYSCFHSAFTPYYFHAFLGSKPTTKGNPRLSFLPSNFPALGAVFTATCTTTTTDGRWLLEALAMSNPNENELDSRSVGWLFRYHNYTTAGNRTTNNCYFDAF